VTYVTFLCPRVSVVEPCSRGSQMSPIDSFRVAHGHQLIVAEQVERLV
jgi:hypothetical protein